MQAKYVHTNLIAQNCRKIAAFYQQAFGCTIVVAESVLSGRWLDQVSGVPGAEIHLIHLRLPGCGDTGPTLEIIQYNRHERSQPTAANRPGFGHIAFAVEDVQVAQAAVMAAGGGNVGEIVSADLPGRGHLTVIYATDPEGNIIELQHWAP